MHVPCHDSRGPSEGGGGVAEGGLAGEGGGFHYSRGIDAPGNTPHMKNSLNERFNTFVCDSVVEHGVQEGSGGGS